MKDEQSDQKIRRAKNTTSSKLKSAAALLVLLGIIVANQSTSWAKAPGRRPAAWTPTKSGAIAVDYKEQIKKAFLRSANASISIVRDDINHVKKVHEYNCEYEGEIVLPNRLTEDNVTVVPYAFTGIYGRTCSTGRGSCNPDDVETYLVVIPYIVKCDRSTIGHSLMYKMTFVKDRKSGRASASGPWKVEVKQ